jgi:spore coat polysaccharide biosynthesis protein SpsF
MGVLIHQSPETLPQVMSEIVRCANKFVLCGEYFSEEEVEIPYRGHRGALYKQDFGGLYSRLFPDLELIESGFLTQSDGFDDITYWIFKKH